ncbi:MAG: hypothetical protein LBD59_01525 [Prevotellaceae bacterium]|jgi:hypothetical protein|nr:hypothetical protein [Prevotellaceae bacterium]
MLSSSFSGFYGFLVPSDTEMLSRCGMFFAISEMKRERERERERERRADNQYVTCVFCSRRNIIVSALAWTGLYPVAQTIQSLNFHNTYNWRYSHSGYFPFAGISLPSFIYFSDIFSNLCRKGFRQTGDILGLNGLNTAVKEKYSDAKNSVPVYRAGTASLILIFNISYLPDNCLHAVSAGWTVTASLAIKGICHICYGSNPKSSQKLNSLINIIS